MGFNATEISLDTSLIIYLQICEDLSKFLNLLQTCFFTNRTGRYGSVHVIPLTFSPT